MTKSIFILRTLCNVTVTFNNFDIIRAAADNTHFRVIDYASYKSIKKGSKDDIYVVSTFEDVIKVRLSGRKNIFFWIQGIIPEESFMRHKSFLRYWILSVGEYLALKCSKYHAFVSLAMRTHYQNKYKLRFDDHYIFPCFNAFIEQNAFFQDENKYKNNCFVYAGGLAVWQCFDQTLEIYKKIEEKNIPETKLIILTKDKYVAMKKIKEMDIKNFEINYFTPKELPLILASAKFGFVIREDDPVNRVSTPTKISTYLSCGLIPIYGNCIQSFAEMSADMKYAINWDNTNASYEKLISFMKSSIDAKDVFAEYNEIFCKYFSNEYHIKRIKDIFLKMHL